MGQARQTYNGLARISSIGCWMLFFVKTTLAPVKVIVPPIWLLFVILL
jgi:hypothetical protein